MTGFWMVRSPRAGTNRLSFIHSFIHPCLLSPHLHFHVWGAPAVCHVRIFIAGLKTQHTDKYFLVPTVCQAPCRGGQASHCPSQECRGNQQEPHAKWGLNEDAYGGVGG